MAQPLRRYDAARAGPVRAVGNNRQVPSPSSRPSPSPTPKDYVLKEIIGKGSFGTVYKAHKKGAEQPVAIKLMRITGLSKEQKDNLITEITILKKVKNRYVVQLIDFQWDDSYIYLIFEYCSGGELSQFIKASRKVPEDVAKHFLQQIAMALRALRSLQIAHMDLKPQNILLSKPVSSTNNLRNVCLKIVDFGLSQILHFDEDDEEYGTSFRGSPLYMAPEIFTRRVYDARVDLWSVGVILYECLFGQPPFQSTTRSGLIEKITDSRPIRIPPTPNITTVVPSTVKISSKCKDLLVRLLQRDPSQRMTFDEFFSHPFIDLEHAPSPESYHRGVKFISEAVKADQDCDYHEAFKFYELGLLYLVPIYQWGDGVNVTDDSKAEQLKNKLLHYMDRAEQLKEKCDDFTPLPYQQEEEIQRGLDLLEEAEDLSKVAHWNESWNLYNEAFEILIPIVSNLKGQLKTALFEEVSRHMTHAEDVKSKLKSQGHKSNTIGANANGSASLNMVLRSGRKLPAYNGESSPKKEKARLIKAKTSDNLLTDKEGLQFSNGHRDPATKLPNSDFILRTFRFKNSQISSANPCNIQ